MGKINNPLFDWNRGKTIDSYFFKPDDVSLINHLKKSDIIQKPNKSQVRKEWGAILETLAKQKTNHDASIQKDMIKKLYDLLKTIKNKNNLSNLADYMKGQMKSECFSDQLQTYLSHDENAIRKNLKWTCVKF